MSFLLHIEPAQDQWAVRAGESGTRPTRGHLDPRGLLDHAAALRAPAGLALPGRDAAQCRRELEFGQRLMLALRQAGVSERLMAWAANPTGPLAVDAHGAAAGVPWELLAPLDRPHLEESGVAVLRLGPAGRASTPAALARMGWSPTPQDPLCAARLAQLPDSADGPLLLHVVCHGANLGGLLDTGGGGAAALVAQLDPMLRRAHMVVLEVCEAGAPQDLEALPNRLVSLGAPVCIAPRGRVTTQVLDTVAAALQQHGPSGVVSAIRAARAAVRALGLPRPDGRWHNLRAHVGSLEGLTNHGVWSPEGWPAPHAALAAVMQKWRQASAHTGFIGLEDLASALGQSGPAALDAAARARNLQPVQGADCTPTPRIQRWGRLLGPGFDQDRLRQLLEDALGAPALAAAPSSGGTTLELAVGNQPATSLEVLGGPQDGLQLHPRPGDHVGRWRASDAAELPLYEGTARFDPYLSRRHLRWETDHVVLLRPMTLRRGGHDSLQPPGPLQAMVGDVLLTPGTALRLR